MGRIGQMIRAWWPLCWRSTCVDLLARNIELSLEMESLRPRAEAWDGVAKMMTADIRQKARDVFPVMGVLDNDFSNLDKVLPFRRVSRREGFGATEGTESTKE